MTHQELKDLEDKIVNCQLLEVAINAVESLRVSHLPEGSAARWIEEMKEEAGFQVSQHDEDRSLLLENTEMDNGEQNAYNVKSTKD